MLDAPVLRVERVRLWHVRLPLLFPFETSFGRVQAKDSVLIAVDADGITGWGEAPAAALPNFSYETVPTALHILRDFLVPLLLATPCTAPEELPTRCQPVRGHPMAKHGLESACWDWFARRRGIALATAYGGRPGPIPAGISLGLEPTVEALVERIRAALAQGYRRVKLKIKPGWDRAMLETVRWAFPNAPLTADANGAYAATDVKLLQSLDAFGLRMLEQPLHYEDFGQHAALAPHLTTPLCLDESIRNAADAAHALDIGACRIINIKPARVGGPTQARLVHDVCHRRGIPVWCGGLLETGIGRAHNLAMATLPGFTLPGDLSASDRYWREDVIDPPVRLEPDGTIQVPDGVGLGFRVCPERIDAAAIGRWELVRP